MKKNRIGALSILFLCYALVSTLNAQDRSGIITYKGIVNKTYVNNFLTDLKAQKDVPMRIKQRVVDMYVNATPDEYVLNFKNEESYYYHNPALNPEGGYNVGSMAGLNSFYTNNETDSIIEISRHVGNIFHEPLDWEITNETKTIGGYKCYKAVATEVIRGAKKRKNVVAWFTPQVPLNFGPQHYKGLPGLILEIKRNKFTLKATELNLNPKKDIKIKRLDQDEEIITQEEAQKRLGEMVRDRRR